jgi:hypothetical protein
MTAPVSVRCAPTAEGWTCRVVLGDDAAATAHDVRVGRTDLATLAPGATPEWLVEASFAFLLEREPRESILRRFDLPVIERYFPEYRVEIARRLG